MKSNDFKKYVDANGGFELPKYMYNIISDLMKTSLDMGTMICQDSAKLRAYKEQVKSIFKTKWLDLASVFESFGIIEPCICNGKDFCKICGGSRYLLNEVLSVSELQHISAAYENDEVAAKLQAGMKQAEKDVMHFILNNLRSEEDGEEQEEQAS